MKGQGNYVMTKFRYLRRPFTHQHAMVLFGIKHPRWANYSEPGVGKSKAIIDVARYRMKAREVDKALIIAPLSVLWSWKKEVRINSNYESVIIYGTASERMSLLKKQESRFFITNYESLNISRVYDTIKAMKFGMVVFDESIKLKNPESQRTMRSWELAKIAKFVTIMSGRPITKDAADLFGQWLVLDSGETFGKNFYRFRRIFFRKAPVPFPKWELKKEWNPILNKWEPTALRTIKWAIYKKTISFTKKQCLDLPPKTFETRHIIPSLEQQKARKTLLAKGSVKLGKNGEISVKNTLNICMKEQQICSGFTYLPNSIYTFSQNPKLEALYEILVDELGKAKAVIVCRYHYELDIIRDMCHNRLGVQTVELSGRSNKNNAVKKFREDSKTKYIISQIAAGCLGVDGLQHVCSNMVFYSVDYRLDHYDQMCDRIDRQGQKEPCTYYHLVAKGTVDEDILSAIERKRDISDYLLNIAVRRKKLEK